MSFNLINNIIFRVIGQFGEMKNTRLNATQKYAKDIENVMHEFNLLDQLVRNNCHAIQIIIDTIKPSPPILDTLICHSVKANIESLQYIPTDCIPYEIVKYIRSIQCLNQNAKISQATLQKISLYNPKIVESYRASQEKITEL